jgi:hypothetical protein
MRIPVMFQQCIPAKIMFQVANNGVHMVGIVLGII